MTKTFEFHIFLKEIKKNYFIFLNMKHSKGRVILMYLSIILQKPNSWDIFDEK
jgi:hypothetical protein